LLGCLRFSGESGETMIDRNKQLEAVLAEIVMPESAGYDDDGHFSDRCRYCNHQVEIDDYYEEQFTHEADCPIAKARKLLEVGGKRNRSHQASPDVPDLRACKYSAV
jgi:hypothetical protein